MRTEDRPRITSETPLKFLDKDGRGPQSRSKWRLPAGDRPGAWMPAVGGALVLCERGYHLTTAAHAPRWVDAALYVAEADGEALDGGDKTCHRRARLLYRVEAWGERTMRLFACDCAEHVLPIFEERRPGDGRPRRAVEVARRYADGEATIQELREARADADAAAYAAAAYAAAAYAAAHAADAAAYAADAAEAAADAAAYTADAAAHAAAEAAAAAADAAARKRERAWQTALLLRYLNGEAA
jgi:hypothetical protein